MRQIGTLWGRFPANAVRSPAPRNFDPTLSGSPDRPLTKHCSELAPAHARDMASTGLRSPPTDCHARRARCFATHPSTRAQQTHSLRTQRCSASQVYHLADFSEPLRVDAAPAPLPMPAVEARVIGLFGPGDREPAHGKMARDVQNAGHRCMA